ncbi:MAG: hypothetical protein H6727_12660 [Myxococcales bacterium]|nr:hypothetical protein [Myxococcales bacterium]
MSHAQPMNTSILKKYLLFLSFLCFTFLTTGLLSCDGKVPGNGLYDGSTQGGRETNDLEGAQTDAAPEFSPELKDEGQPEATPEPAEEQAPETTAEPTSPEVVPTEKAPKTTPEKIVCPTPKGDPIDRVQRWRDDLKLAAPLLLYGQLSPCKGEAFRIVAPAKMEITIEVHDLSPGDEVTLSVYNTRRLNGRAQDKALATGKSLPDPWVYLQATIDQSGEIGIVLDAARSPHPIRYGIKAYCSKNCYLETTRYPIVFMHGFMGTDKYFGFLDYFYKIKPFLEEKGYSVFTPVVQPIASSSTRVLSLKQQIDGYFQQTGARKMNMIAHSQGGVDGRLLIAAHNYGNLIASLTTISTPHRGVPVPNLLIQPSQELGEKNMEDYNKKYPNDARVKYYSWAGISCGLLDSDCRKKNKDEVVDPVISAIYVTLKQLRGDNDGIVTVESAKWGDFLGLIPADHFDEVGQIADTNNKSFNHKDFYLSEARRLTKVGF